MESVIRQFTLSRLALGMNLEGLTHADSLRAPEGGGNPLNWVLGHIIDSRSGLLGLLGEEPLWGSETHALYERGSDPTEGASAFLDLDELRRLLDASQERVVSALAEADPETLGRRLPKPHPVLGETVREAMSGLAFHEAYHVGQIGLLRRAAGHGGAIR